MNRRLKIEIAALLGTFALWYGLAPDEVNYTKCSFSAEDPKVLSECQEEASIVELLTAKEEQAQTAIHITRDMLNLFQTQLKQYHEQSPFASGCASQDRFYWLRLESLQAASNDNPVSLQQIYVSFPETSMNGQELDHRIPLLKTEAAMDRSIEVGPEIAAVEGLQVYVPRLADCDHFEMQLHYESSNSEGLKSHTVERVRIPSDGHFEIQAQDTKMAFRLISKDVTESSGNEPIHQTLSFDNKLLLITDIFQRSLAIRFAHMDALLNMAFIIDYHNRILPHFTRGSIEIWRQTVSDFNFVIDSGVIQGLLPDSLQQYSIN